MSRPLRLLDLFCGAGGAAMGYFRAGFTDITGVDIKPMPRYPFTFVQVDALEFCKSFGAGFDAIHASPPCQGYSIMRNLPWLRDRTYPMLIPETRRCLEAVNRPFIIENVAGARRSEKHPEGLRAFWLCGQQVGLPIFRHRYFESSFFWMKPPHHAHTGVIRHSRMLGDRAREPVVSAPTSHGITRHRAYHLTARPSGPRYGFDTLGSAVGHSRNSRNSVTEALGVEWMTRDEACQAIPPAYTEYIGRQLLQQLAEARVEER